MSPRHVAFHKNLRLYVRPMLAGAQLLYCLYARSYTSSSIAALDIESSTGKVSTKDPNPKAVPKREPVVQTASSLQSEAGGIMDSDREPVTQLGACGVRRHSEGIKACVRGW